MAKIALNKSEMKRQIDKLKTYKKFLPSLDLKRKQIIAQRNKARDQVRILEAELREHEDQICAHFPMLPLSSLNLDGLMKVTSVKIGKENVVGVHLPVFEGYETETTAYGRLATPHWMDPLMTAFSRLLGARLKIKVAEKRLKILEYALQKTTQRLNLFDKVLIPEAQQNIKYIKIYLSDFERASVIQAKIAKGKSEVREANAKKNKKKG